jgi:hypothetical protein
VRFVRVGAVITLSFSLFQPISAASADPAGDYSSKATSYRNAYIDKTSAIRKAEGIECFASSPNQIPQFSDDIPGNDLLLKNYASELVAWQQSTLNESRIKCSVVAPTPIPSPTSVPITNAAEVFVANSVSIQTAIKAKIDVVSKALKCVSLSPPGIPSYLAEDPKGENKVIFENYVSSLNAWLDKAVIELNAKCPAPAPSTTTDINQASKQDFEVAMTNFSNDITARLKAYIGTNACASNKLAPQPIRPTFGVVFEDNVAMANKYVAAMESWLSESQKLVDSCNSVSASPADSVANTKQLHQGLIDKLNFYINYYKCSSFTSTPAPDLSSITQENSQSISNAIYSWYDENFKRVQIECQAINLDYRSLSDNALVTATNKLKIISSAESCESRQNTASPTVPNFNSSPHQNLNDYQVFLDALNNWYTQNQNSIFAECRKTSSNPVTESPTSNPTMICKNSLSSIESKIQYTGENLVLISELWATYERITTFSTSKGISLAKANEIYQNWTIGETEKLKQAVVQLIELKGICGSTDIYSQWGTIYDKFVNYLNQIPALLNLIQTNFPKYSALLPRYLPQIGKVTQIAGGCQVEILNYDPSFTWYAKGNLLVDKNGIGTITGGPGEDYLSTYKLGYATVNYTEKIFMCTGVKSNTSFDAEAPKLSVISVSPNTVAKGSPITVSLLGTDNKELNTLVVYLIDPVGTVVDRFEGTAISKRIRGDQLVGLYEVQLYPRMVSYEGVWNIWGFARDLNSNSGVGSNLAQVEVRNIVTQTENSLTPKLSINVDTSTVLTISTIEVESTQPSANPEQRAAIETNSAPVSNVKSSLTSEGNIRSVGTLSSIRSSVASLVSDDAERDAINSVFKRIDSSPVISTSRTIILPKSKLVEVVYKSNTPKVCSISVATVMRKSSGTCILTIATYDSDGNSFEVQKKIVLKK